MRCEGCKKRIPISDVMTCKWCEEDFCMYCRLPEEHRCEKLDILRDTKKQILGEQLVKVEKNKIDI
jgi:predicted nucleic acid binding AN1-type Zn finger protein